MNSRQRFNAVMRYSPADRVPYFEEEIREEVIQAWRGQGLPPGADLSQMFSLDRHEHLEPDLDPLPEPASWPASVAELDDFKQFLNPDDPARFPAHWSRCVRLWRFRKHPLMLRVHHGLFLALGVDGWHRFTEVIRLLALDPRFVRRAMDMQAEFTARLAEKTLRVVDVDAAVVTEPICDMHGPLISPRMYEEYALRSYVPLLEVLARHRVATIVFRTFANARLLLPGVLKRGFNCLWASEVYQEAMDYRELRREFGRDLRLIGGIDLNSLRRGKEAIRREILEKAPALLEQGGYIPMADGRIREDVPYENYVYYRRLLEQVTQSGV